MSTTSPASIPTVFPPLMEERFATCCFPSGECLIGSPVDITCEADTSQSNNGSSANKMYCTNISCDVTQSRYIHTHCLEQLENQLAQKAKKLASESKNSSLKNLSDKQIRQNIWNFKADLQQLYSETLSCSCNRGHLTRDPSNAAQLGGGDSQETEPFQIVSSGGKRGGSGSKKRGFVNFTNNVRTSNSGAVSTSPSNSAFSNKANHQSNPSAALHAKFSQAQPKQISRIRNSLSTSDMSMAAGNSPVSGANTASSSPGTTAVAYSPDSMSPRSAGSASHLSSSKWAGGGGLHSSPPTSARLNRRSDFSSLQNALDAFRYNVFHVKIDDDLPSDEYKDSFFQTLRSRSLNMVCCLICNKRLAVYDRYPLIDGLVFISSVRHHQDETRSIPFNLNTSSNKLQQFMSCVCINCLQGNNNVMSCCCFCGREWIGASYQIGVIYPFDIFASNVCCSERSKCSHCDKQLVSSTRPLPQRYAEYSLPFSCPSCQKVDCHFVKPVHRLFKIQTTSNY